MSKPHVPQPSTSTEVRELNDLITPTGNLYESVSIIGKRANQINSRLKQELHAKLEEFVSVTDNLEEVFENKEQIEISRHYEKLPNPALMATEEFMKNKVYFRHQDSE